MRQPNQRHLNVDGSVTVTTYTGDHVLLDVSTLELIGKHNIEITRRGYARIRQGNKRVSLHRLIVQPAAGLVVDHINFNKLDNRIQNLRICTHKDNSHHSTMRSKNKSGYRGVVWHKRDRRWQASIRDGKIIFLGNFDTAVEAALAYNVSAIKYHKGFASLNVI